jgi:hypothetical protein
MFFAITFSTTKISALIPMMIPSASTLPHRALVSTSNHAEELHHLQSRSIARSPALAVRSMSVSLILFQGLSEERLEGAQENLQVSQRGAWKHAGAD